MVICRPKLVGEGKEDKKKKMVCLRKKRRRWVCGEKQKCEKREREGNDENCDGNG